MFPVAAVSGGELERHMLYMDPDAADEEGLSRKAAIPSNVCISCSYEMKKQTRTWSQINFRMWVQTQIRAKIPSVSL